MTSYLMIPALGVMLCSSIAMASNSDRGPREPFRFERYEKSEVIQSQENASHNPDQVNSKKAQANADVISAEKSTFNDASKCTNMSASLCMK